MSDAPAAADVTEEINFDTGAEFIEVKEEPESQEPCADKSVLNTWRRDSTMQ